MSYRKRVTVAVLGAVLTAALTGCTVAAETSTAVTAEADAVLGAAPVREITVAVPKPRNAAPALRTTGVAWQPILQSLTGYGQWVLANPDPTKVTDVAAPGCAFTQTLGRRVQGLLTSNAYQESRPPAFLAVTGPAEKKAGEGTTTPIADTVTVYAAVSRESEPVMSRAGVQLATIAPLPATRLHITLQRGTDNQWRFCTIDPMDSLTTTPSLL